MLVRCFTITTVEEFSGVYPVAIDGAQGLYVYSALGIPRRGDDWDCELARFSGRKRVIPAGRRAYRRYANSALPGLAVIIGDVAVCGDMDLVAYNGLTKTSLCLVKPRALLLAQCGCTVECIRYTGLGVEYA